MLEWFSKSFQAIEMRPSQGGATLVRRQSSFVKYSAVLLKIRPAARIFRGITSQWAIS